MIATITLNPCLDRYLIVNGLKIDHTNRWFSSRLYAGGKGIDVSRAVYEMGGATVAYGFIGGDAGRTVEILLDEDGVLFSFTPIAQETRTNFIIQDTVTGEQTRIDAPGPHIRRKELLRFARKLRQVRPFPDMLVIGGSVPPGIPADIYFTIIAEAREHSVRTILDAEGRWLEEGIKAKPYLIKPNIPEAEGLLGKTLDSEEAIIAAALALVKEGIEIVVISRGKDGIIAATREEIVKAVSPPVKARSSVGAGDSTVAGLALKLAYGGPLIEACRLGVAMGAAAVLTPGTELCRQEDTQKLLPRVKVWRIAVSDWPQQTFPAQ